MTTCVHCRQAFEGVKVCTEGDGGVGAIWCFQCAVLKLPEFCYARVTKANYRRYLR